MMKPAYFLISVILTLGSACNTAAKEWRGIVPLQSNRAHVQRLLGQPQQATDDAFYYSLADEIAVVWFKVRACDVFGFGWNVPIGTVTSIGVILRGKQGKDKLLSGSQYEVTNAEAGFSFYTNEDEGISLETYNGIVTHAHYTPAKKEENRRCPRIQECCADFFPLFDEFQNLSWRDEKARLDNYVIYMNEGLQRGVIVVYGPDPKDRAQRMKRVQRGRQYLIRVRHIQPERVLIVDGGYRKSSVTALNLYPIGGLISRVYLFPEMDPVKKK